MLSFTEVRRSDFGDMGEVSCWQLPGLILSVDYPVEDDVRSGGGLIDLS